MEIDKKTREIAKELRIDDIEETIKMGSPEEMAWKTIMKSCEENLAKSKRDQELLTISRDHAEKRMKEEAEKFKKQ